MRCMTRKFAQDKLLRQSVYNSSSGSDQRTIKDQTWAAFALRIVEIRERTRGQITANAGVVEL